MTDPITLAIAAAIAGKGAEALGAQAGPALAHLVRRVKERFADRPEDTAALAAAEAHPESAEHRAALAAALSRATTTDPTFAKDLHALWQQIDQTATDNAVINNLNASADKVVQLRDVHGDFHIS